MLDPLGAAITFVALVGFVAGVLKTTGVLAVAGADPVGVGMIVVSLALLALGLTRGRAASRRDDTGDWPPPPVTVPPEATRPTRRPLPEIEALEDTVRRRGLSTPTPLATAAQPRPEPPPKPPEEAVTAPPPRPEPALQDPRDALAARLALLHDEGRRLKRNLLVAAAAAVGEAMTGDPPKTRVWCERETRAWDGRVAAAVHDHGDTAFVSEWQSSATLPAAHPTLWRIEPTTGLGEVRGFVDAKLACLRGIIAELGGGEVLPEPNPPPTRQRESEAERTPTPIERLQTQLDRAMNLRGIVARGVPQHWEGDVLVDDDPEDEVKLDNLVYAWVKETYDLLRKPPFTRHADEFWGEEFVGLDSGYLRTAYGVEREKIGRDRYLDRRIELLKHILQEHGG